VSNRISWPSFLKRFGKSSETQILRVCGGKSPAATIDAIEMDFKLKRIDKRTMNYRIELARKWGQYYNDDRPVVRCEHPTDAWTRIGEGTFKKRDIKRSDA
jgi:hypothetical protein